MAAAPDAQREKGVTMGVALLAAALLCALGYFVIVFIAGLVGLIQQLAHPAARYEANATILLATAPVFVAMAYVFVPELEHWRERLAAAGWISLAPTALLPLVLGVLLPSLSTAAPWRFAAALVLIVLTFGVLPTLALGRLLVFCHPERRLAQQGDHYVDPDTLSGEMHRIVGRHTQGTFRRPAGWRRSFFGDRGRLTYGDLQRMVALEIAQCEQLRAACQAQAAAAEASFAARRAALLAAAPEGAWWREAMAPTLISPAPTAITALSDHDQAHRDARSAPPMAALEAPRTRQRRRGSFYLSPHKRSRP